ncbi:hypothetical protein MPER_08403, partial [Moniliophthora perniciosa FA553]
LNYRQEARWLPMQGSYTTTLFLDTPVEVVDKLMSVNFRGVFLFYKYAAKQMIAQGRGGRIIGASSLAGTRLFLTGQ